MRVQTGLSAIAAMSGCLAWGQAGGGTAAELSRLRAERADLVQQRANIVQFGEARRAYQEEYTQAVEPVRKAVELYMEAYRLRKISKERQGTESEASELEYERRRVAAERPEVADPADILWANLGVRMIDYAISRAGAYAEQFRQADAALRQARAEFAGKLRRMEARIASDPALAIPTGDGMAPIAAQHPTTMRGLLRAGALVAQAVGEIDRRLAEKDQEIRRAQQVAARLEPRPERRETPRVEPRGEPRVEPRVEPRPERMGGGPATVYRGRLKVDAPQQASNEYASGGWEMSPLTLRVYFGEGRAEADPVQFSMRYSETGKTAVVSGRWVFEPGRLGQDGAITGRGTVSTQMDTNENGRTNRQQNSVPFEWRATPKGGCEEYEVRQGNDAKAVITVRREGGPAPAGCGGQRGQVEQYLSVFDATGARGLAGQFGRLAQMEAGGGDCVRALCERKAAALRNPRPGTAEQEVYVKLVTLAQEYLRQGVRTNDQGAMGKGAQILKLCATTVWPFRGGLTPAWGSPEVMQAAQRLAPEFFR